MESTENRYKQIKANPGLLADYLLDNFKNNIIIFKKYFPEIAEKFENYSPKKSMDFFCSSNGVPNLQFTGDTSSIYPQKSPSQYLSYLNETILNPDKLAKNKSDCPLEFSKYQVEDILNNCRLVSLLVNRQYDPHGQIHFKYMNRIHDILARDIMDKKFCKLCDTVFVPVFVSNGVGLGYHLKELSEKKLILNTIVIEPDPDIFFASLHTFEWAEYIENTISAGKTLSFILDEDIELIGKKFYLFFIEQGIFNMGGISIYDIYEDDLSHSITDELKRIYLSLPAAYGFLDDRVFGIGQTCYSLINKKKFVLKKPLKDNYRNYPVFVVGSGPSLDNDLHFLKKNQDKAIIIACGTAIDSLYHAGVMPDFYANTERTPEVRQALDVIPDKKFLNDITLLCSSVCHPYVVRCFEKTAIFGKEDENFTDYLIANLDESIKFEKIQTIRNMNPLVGNMGMSAAVTLGFEKIYLFGIDNGKKSTLENMHSQYTSLYTKNGTSDKHGNYVIQKTVPGNFGGLCETNNVYIKSIMNIEAALYSKKDDITFECINCSDGAKIKHTKAVRSSELEEYFDSLPKLNKQEFFDYFSNELTKNFNVTEEQLKNILHADIIGRIYDNILEMIEQSPHTQEDYLILVNRINDYLSTIRTKLSTFYSRTAESSLNSMLIELVTSLFCEDREAGQKAADDILDLIKDYLVEAKELFFKLPDYIVGEHRKYYPDGKVGRDMPHCPAPIFPPPINIIGCNYDDPIKIFVKKYN